MKITQKQAIQFWNAISQGQAAGADGDGDVVYAETKAGSILSFIDVPFHLWIRPTAFKKSAMEQGRQAQVVEFLREVADAIDSQEQEQGEEK